MTGTEGHALIELVQNHDPATPVPTCPGWTLTDLLGHTVGAWCWAIQVVTAGADYTERELEPPGADLIEWSLGTLLELVALLEATPDDRPVWTPVGRIGDTRWWRRKMAVETALHRWDGSHAVDTDTPIDATTAVDGIEEHATEFLPGMVRMRHQQWGTVVLRATDVESETTVDLGGPGTSLVTGTASNLLLWMWNRPVTVDAPAELAERWSTLVI